MKITTIESISIAGSASQENQDYVSSFSNGAILLDGASPLKKDSEYPTHKFVQDFVDTFIKFEDDGHDSIEDALKSTLNHLKATSGLSDLSKSPSASAVIVRINNNTLECIQIGDCKVFIYGSEFKLPTAVFPPSRIEFLDEIALNAQSAYLDLGFNTIEARESINSLLLNHRQLMNKDNGYASLTLASYNSKHISYKSIELDSKLKYKVLLASDGFYSGFEKYSPNSIVQVFNEKTTLLTAAREYRAIEDNDKELVQYPRFKLHDDSTALLLEIT